MIDSKQLSTILGETFHFPIKTLNITPLFGDASSRIYYRVTWEEEGLGRSAILMAMAHSAGAKITAEIGGGGRSEINEIPFINVQKHLSACKIPVPEIYAYRGSLGWMLLEDLGDVSLHAHVAQYVENSQARLDVYKNAIDLLIDMQCRATQAPKRSTIAHLRHFDSALFLWEFEHFIEYGMAHRTAFGTTQLAPPSLPAAKRAELMAHFLKISTALAALPQVFTHRDYHSRNLMIQSGPDGIKIRVIDFQDALMGPPEYDLASLLRDSYVELPETVIDELIAYYLETAQQVAGVEKQRDALAFRKSFDLISIQRNLKAAGRFIFIDKVKKKDHLLPYVTPTLNKVKHSLLKYPHLEALHRLLADYVPELQ